MSREGSVPTAHAAPARAAAGSMAVVGRLAIVTQLRRVMVTVLLALLPIGFYLALRSQPNGGAMGGLATASAWALSFVALFGFRANAGVDARLTRLGLAARSIFVGRLAAYALIAAALAGALALFAMVLDDRPFRVGLTASLLAAVTAVPIGVLVGVLVPGDVEGPLVVLALYGIPFGLSGDSPALKFTPSFGPLKYAYALGEHPSASWFIHPISIGLVATALAALAWERATRRGVGLDPR